MSPKPGDPGYRAALILSCAFFMVCSAGMLVFNKLVLRRISLPITVVMIQMASTVLLLVVMPCGVHFGSAPRFPRTRVRLTSWRFSCLLRSGLSITPALTTSAYPQLF